VSGRFYYLLSFLPSLPNLGGDPALSLDDVAKLLKGQSEEALQRLARVVEVERDIRQTIESRCLGSEPAIVELPEALVAAFPSFEEGKVSISEDVWVSKVWIEFYAWLHNEAKNVGSNLLKVWADLELGVVCQLCRARYETADEAIPEGHPLQFVGVECIRIDEHLRSEVHDLVRKWEVAADPIKGELLLDTARWRWIVDREKTYSFEIDELVAYVLKLRLLSRHLSWSRDEGMKILGEVTAL